MEIECVYCVVQAGSLNVSQPFSVFRALNSNLYMGTVSSV